MPATRTTTRATINAISVVLRVVVLTTYLHFHFLCLFVWVAMQIGYQSWMSGKHRGRKRGFRGLVVQVLPSVKQEVRVTSLSLPAGGTPLKEVLKKVLKKVLTGRTLA
jgi:hypothetical protein